MHNLSVQPAAVFVCPFEGKSLPLHTIWTCSISVWACCILSYCHAPQWRACLCLKKSPCGKAAARSPCSCLFCRLNKPRFLGFSSQGKCSCPWPLQWRALRWTHSNLLISCL